MPYPATFWPLPGYGGLSGDKVDVSTAVGLAHLQTAFAALKEEDPDGTVVMFGHSQGARIVTQEKRILDEELTPAEKERLMIVLLGNPNRPNGGLLERLSFLGHVPILDLTFDGPTPTDTGIVIHDIGGEYDFIADFPMYPLNPVAVVNAAAGFWYIHGNYLAPIGFVPYAWADTPYGYTPEELQVVMDDPANRQVYGDTTHITIPTKNLPLLQPGRDTGVITGTSWIVDPLLDLIQPATRVVIDTAYDRDIPYGEPTPAGIIPRIDPGEFVSDFVAALGEGVHDVFGDPDTASVAARQPARLVSQSDQADDAQPDPATKRAGTQRAKPSLQALTSRLTGAQRHDGVADRSAERPDRPLVNAVTCSVNAVVDRVSKVADAVRPAGADRAAPGDN